jgi:hypothetical protein
VQPSEIAEAIMMTFRLNPNAFVEEITLQVPALESLSGTACIIPCSGC